MEKLTCKRCGHQWFPRSEAKPAMCPACKNRYWDKERKNKTKKERK
jgi:predicted Zn-ribbon and HTH transcriptional regulator